MLYGCREDIEKAGRIINCSEDENQTAAMLVSGGTQSNREYNSGDTRRQ